MVNVLCCPALSPFAVVISSHASSQWSWLLKPQRTSSNMLFSRGPVLSRTQPCSVCSGGSKRRFNSECHRCLPFLTGYSWDVSHMLHCPSVPSVFFFATLVGDSNPLKSKLAFQPVFVKYDLSLLSLLVGDVSLCSCLGKMWNKFNRADLFWKSLAFENASWCL